jgi:hypothetical protein
MKNEDYTFSSAAGTTTFLLPGGLKASSRSIKNQLLIQSILKLAALLSPYERTWVKGLF